MRYPFFSRLRQSRPSSFLSLPSPGSKPYSTPRFSRLGWLIVLSLVPIAYSLWVLGVVAWTGDIGLNCVLGIEVKETIAPDFIWVDRRPGVGDRLTQIDGQAIHHYPGYVAAIRGIR